MNDLSFSKLIEIFAERRAETVKFVANLSEEDLQKMGKHPSLGEVNLFEMIKMMYLRKSTGKAHYFSGGMKGGEVIDKRHLYTAQLFCVEK